MLEGLPELSRCAREGCKEIFEKTVSNKLFCSTLCKNQSYRKKQKAKKEYRECNLEGCTNTFEKTKYNRKYCSKKCSNKYYANGQRSKTMKKVDLSDPTDNFLYGKK